MKTTTQLALVTALTASLVAPAQADSFSFSIGASYWAPEISGDFNNEGETTIDLVDDLDLDDPAPTSLVLTLEHPIWLLPNLRFQTVDLDSDGRNRLERDITFEGETYNLGETVTSTFDMSHNDIVFYYQVLDNWVSLDVGLNIKTFDGEISIAGSTNTEESSVDIEESIPLLYLAAKFDLPITGLYLGANVSSLSFDDTSLNDITLSVGYQMEVGLGIEGGIRTFALELDDVEDVESDLEYEGAYIQAYYRF